MKKLFRKIRDLFDVAKYKRQRNTFENKYNSLNEKYIKVLEFITNLEVKVDSYENQIKKLKEERKELKRIIEEEMIPKKRK